jgi:hypothetical protein
MYVTSDTRDVMQKLCRMEADFQTVSPPVALRKLVQKSSVSCEGEFDVKTYEWLSDLLSSNLSDFRFTFRML